MDLVLWRHCEAAPGLPDEARPLTPRGVAQAAAMAKWLAARLPRRCRILASPAVRAQQTARFLARGFETTADAGTGTTIDALLDAAGWPDAGQSVVVVGHQPTLGRTASRLIDGDDADRVLAPGAMCWLTRAAGGSASLHAFVTPDALPASR